MPCRRSSYSAALRSARANALNVASTMWCEFLPASCRMCSVVPEVLTKDCRVRGWNQITGTTGQQAGKAWGLC